MGRTQDTRPTSAGELKQFLSPTVFKFSFVVRGMSVSMRLFMNLSINFIYPLRYRAPVDETNLASDF